MSFCYADSGMVSRYYPMFCKLGYPQLDVIRFEDGEWCIIEYLNAPLVPSLTKWHHVLKGLRNIEITEGFLKKFIRQIDPRERAFWDREQNATNRMEQEKIEQEQFIEYRVEQTVKALSKNEALKERIAKNGVQELDLHKIARHIPPNQLKEICKP